MAAIKVNFRQVSKYFFETYFDAFSSEIGKYISLVTRMCLVFLLMVNCASKNLINT